MIQLRNMLKFRMAWAEPSGPHAGVALSSRIRLARNLRSLPFCHRASPKTLQAVLKSALEALRKTRPLSKAAYILLDDLEPAERLFLTERRLISRQLAAAPKHRGVIVGDREVPSVMVNEEDHLRLQAIDSGLALVRLWEKAKGLSEELSQNLDFARHPEWGYLTACPTNVGTGLRASVLLHLPGLALSGKIPPMLQELARLKMTARGLYGEGTQVLGDLYQISNATTLGRSEEEFLRLVEGVAQKLIIKELEIRYRLSDGSDRIPLENQVYRSLGALSQTRSISYEETIGHFSQLRLGLSLGWKLPLGLEALNELLIITQPGHIQMLAEKPLDPPERDFLRATLLRRRLRA